MKFTENIILQFTFVTFLVVLLVSSFLAYFLSKSMTNSTLLYHAEHYPQLISNFVNLHPELADIYKEKSLTKSSQKSIATLKKLLYFDNIFRLKIWSLDGIVLWSDQEEIIGKSYLDNEDLFLAAKGSIQYEIEHPNKDEHQFELDNTINLEIYVPVIFENKIIGVIELYENADKIFWDIHDSNKKIYLFIGGAGLVTYILLFLIFWKSYHRQKEVTHQLLETQEVIISSLAHQAEIRDIETGKHIERTSRYVRILAEDLMSATQLKYKVKSDEDYLNTQYIEDLVKSAPLHDIGKVGVSDAILKKPGKLTEEEFEEMKKHCEYGAGILQEAETKLARQSFLSVGVQLALSHHERWDGKGYPYGTKGENIPLAARIMAVADVYDALRSKRCYKKAFPHDTSKTILVEGKGTQFDPQIIDSFLRQELMFEKISTEMAD